MCGGLKCESGGNEVWGVTCGDRGVGSEVCGGVKCESGGNEVWGVTCGERGLRSEVWEVASTCHGVGHKGRGLLKGCG